MKINSMFGLCLSHSKALCADVSSGDHNGRTANVVGALYARKCDVTNESEVVAAFAWIRSTFGGCDVFVNNAGRMQAAFMIGTCKINSSVSLSFGLAASRAIQRQTGKNVSQAKSQRFPLMYY